MSSSFLMRRNARRGRERSSKRDLELVGLQGLLVGPEELGAELQRVSEGHALAEVLLQGFGDLLGLTAEHGVAVLVHDDTVVEHVVELGVIVVTVADLGNEQLDLVRLHLVREDLVQRLGVGVRELLGAHVLAGVRVALEVGKADAGDAEQLVLAVEADGRERDAVVDLADLGERARRVVGDDQDPGWHSRATRLRPRAMPFARSRRGPSSPARARRRTACS